MKKHASVMKAKAQEGMLCAIFLSQGVVFYVVGLDVHTVMSKIPNCS